MKGVDVFGRDIMDKETLINRLESMQQRRKKHGDVFDFEVYLGLTFASHELVDELAMLVKADNQIALAEKMYIFQNRFRSAPEQIRKALVYHLGKRHGKLMSFDDLPVILNQLKR